MKYLELGESNLGASRIVLGCMRIADKPLKNTEALLGAALESGVNMFDHADIYGGGESEKRFAEAMKNLRLNGTKFIFSPNAASTRAPRESRNSIFPARISSLP